jgi:hypothetical protein
MLISVSVCIVGMSFLPWIFEIGSVAHAQAYSIKIVGNKVDL